jgi:acetyltransferase-like isoleucine patch superfamily enzyme
MLMDRAYMGMIERIGLGKLNRWAHRGTALAYLRLHGVRYGMDLRLWSSPICSRHRNAEITIGDHVTIHNSLRENPAGAVHPSVLIAANASAVLTIGNHVGMSGVILYCSERIIIEDYVNLGAGVRVFDTDFHPLDASARRVHDLARIASEPVRICRDAWIGAEAMILKGVTVGERAVVGARALVTKDVPPDTTVGGVPAKDVRRHHSIGAPSDLCTLVNHPGQNRDLLCVNKSL